MGYSVDIVGTNLNVLQEELLIMVMLHQRYTITHSMLDQPVHLRPDANITITDDLEFENEEMFKISIIEAALPFGIEADEGGTATIFINDNDSKYIHEQYAYVIYILGN